MLAQVLARGVLWGVLGLAALAAALRPIAPDRYLALIPVVTTAAALAFARPRLHEAWARAAFAPLQYRRTLLAGATASAGMGCAVMLVCGPSLGARGAHPVFIALLFALGAASWTAAAGVARMRAWGIALAGATAAATLGSVLLLGEHWQLFDGVPVLPAFPVSLPWHLRRVMPAPLTLPALCLVVPIFLARASAQRRARGPAAPTCARG